MMRVIEDILVTVVMSRSVRVIRLPKTVIRQPGLCVRLVTTYFTDCCSSVFSVKLDVHAVD